MILKLNDYLRRGKMKINWIKKGLSVVLAGAMVICLAAAAGVPTDSWHSPVSAG